MKSSVLIGIICLLTVSLLPSFAQSSSQEHSEIIENISQLRDNYTHSDLERIMTQSDYFNTIIAYIGIVLGAGAIIITVGFEIGARKQTKKSEAMILSNNKLTGALKKDADELAQLRKEIKEDVLSTLQLKLVYIKRNFTRYQKYYEKYQNEQDTMKKKIHLKIACSYFDRCADMFRIDLDTIRLIEVFGRVIAKTIS